MEGRVFMPGRLHSLLETYPEATCAKCDLTGVSTFIPSGSLPLELHDRLSTDFPKWELEDAGLDSDSASTTSSKSINGPMGLIRRSDLLFAYHLKR